MNPRVFIGHDPREHTAATVAASSLREVTGGEIEPEFLCTDKLRSQGLLTRLDDVRGQRYDLASHEYTSTEFKFSRFLTPILCQSGFALFVDCDVVFLQDPRRMLGDIGAKPMGVVKHNHQPTEPWKMDGQRQATYPRKNWSSVMLFNCAHPANHRLSLRDVNERTAAELHAFYWLNDDEIGTLDPQWNWLVNAQSKPKSVGIAHFTLGGPWISGWKGAEHDDIWLKASGE